MQQAIAIVKEMGVGYAHLNGRGNDDGCGINDLILCNLEEGIKLSGKDNLWHINHDKVIEVLDPKIFGEMKEIEEFFAQLNGYAK